jgi:hypothetical protein
MNWKILEGWIRKYWKDGSENITGMDQIILKKILKGWIRKYKTAASKKMLRRLKIKSGFRCNQLGATD